MQVRDSERLFSEWRYQEALIAALREGSGSERTLLQALYRLWLHGLAKEWDSGETVGMPDLLEERAWSLWNDGRGEEALATISGLPAASFERRALETAILHVRFPFNSPPSGDVHHLARFLTALWTTGRDLEASEAISTYRQAHPEDVRSPLFAMKLAVARGDEKIFNEPSVEEILASGHPEAGFLRATFEGRHGDPKCAEARFKALAREWPFDYRMLKGIYFARRKRGARFMARWRLAGAIRIMLRLNRIREDARKAQRVRG